MQLKDNLEEQPLTIEEKALDKIDRAIQQSSQELKRLSLLYKMRGKTEEARKIDDTLDRMNKRAVDIDETVKQ